MGTVLLVSSSYSKREEREEIFVGLLCTCVQRLLPRVPVIPLPRAKVSEVTRPRVRRVAASVVPGEATRVASTVKKVLEPPAEMDVIRGVCEEPE